MARLVGCGPQAGSLGASKLPKLRNRSKELSIRKPETKHAGARDSSMTYAINLRESNDLDADHRADHRADH
ncbi:MAG: hypothetical protein CME11_03945 [Gemmatimonadetes bacterium]|nr:hypothetical protein [Gemmatimonadota bacterium]